MTRMSIATSASIPVLVATVIATAPARAQLAGATEAPKSFVAGDVYLPSSRVYALVGKTGLGHEHGVIGALSTGRLVLGASQDAGELVFDMTSFRADTDAARRFVRLEGATSESTQRQVTENMLGSAVLDVGRHPTARYRIDSALKMDAGAPEGVRRYRLEGQLILHNVSRPLTIVAEVEPKNGWNRVRGSFRLKQSDFGIKPFTKAFGAVGVADEMTVWGELWVAPSTGSAQPGGAVATR